MLAFSHEGAPFGVILGLTFIIGLGMAGSSVTIYAILADMADVDELITSINRPGTCSGMATFIRKICAGLSVSVIGVLLAMVGYSETLFYDASASLVVPYREALEPVEYGLWQLSVRARAEGLKGMGLICSRRY